MRRNPHFAEPRRSTLMSRAFFIAWAKSQAACNCIHTHAPPTEGFVEANRHLGRDSRPRVDDVRQLLTTDPELTCGFGYAETEQLQAVVTDGQAGMWGVMLRHCPVSLNGNRSIPRRWHPTRQSGTWCVNYRRPEPSSSRHGCPSTDEFESPAGSYPLVWRRRRGEPGCGRFSWRDVAIFLAGLRPRRSSLVLCVESRRDQGTVGSETFLSLSSLSLSKRTPMSPRPSHLIPHPSTSPGSNRSDQSLNLAKDEGLFHETGRYCANVSIAACTAWAYV